MARLDAIPGVGATAARVIIAEVDMTRFPTPAHLTSWARFAPGVRESAGRSKGTGAIGHGNAYLARVLGEAAVSAGKTDTFVGERYRRLARRRGKKKAIVAVGRSILVIVWHLLSDPDAQFHDLGSSSYDTRLGAERAKRNHVHHLEALGYKVTLEPAAGHPNSPPVTEQAIPAPPRAVACPLTLDFELAASGPDLLGDANVSLCTCGLFDC